MEPTPACRLREAWLVQGGATLCLGRPMPIGYGKALALLLDLSGCIRHRPAGMTKRKNGDRLVELGERGELISFRPHFEEFFKGCPRMMESRPSLARISQ